MIYPETLSIITLALYLWLHQHHEKPVDSQVTLHVIYSNPRVHVISFPLTPPLLPKHSPVLTVVPCRSATKSLYTLHLLYEGPLHCLTLAETWISARLPLPCSSLWWWPCSLPSRMTFRPGMQRGFVRLAPQCHFQTPPPPPNPQLWISLQQIYHLPPLLVIYPHFSKIVAVGSWSLSPTELLPQF